MTTPLGTRPPVARDHSRDAFVVTGYEAASAVLRGFGWSSDLRRNPFVPPELRDLPGGNLVMSDPPDHTRLRRAIAPAFNPPAIGRLRARVTGIVEAALDGLHEIGPVIDVVADVGYPISLAVICELLDVGTEGAAVFAEHSTDLLRMAELDANLDEITAGLVAHLEVMLFLTPILAERREHPGEDFISALLTLPDLELHEVMATCLLLLVAGHETTANLIANSTLAMLQNPDQIPHLHTEPDRAVEEFLRLHGPVRLVARTALVDQEIGGVRIPTGQAVLLDLREANRDPERFPAPQRMDLTRTATGHLGFGAGIHFCLGAALARLEAAVALPRLFARYSDLALTGGQIRWRDSTVFHALRNLEVCLNGRVS